MTDRRSRVTPFVGAGAAGLAVAFAVTPLAAAETPQSTSAPADTSGTAGTAGTAKAAPQPEASSSLTPNYGYQKFRVGVQIAAGAVFAPGVTADTAGSVVTIVETGPNVEGGGSITTTCTTAGDTLEAGSSATYCKFPQQRISDSRRAAPLASLSFDDYYYAAPGDSVQLTQTGVQPHLLIDPVAQTAPPVITTCQDEFCVPTRDPIIFNDPAPGPDAVNDCTIDVSVGKSVLIDVEANDKPNAPITALTLAVAPKAGTAAVESTKIRYTPDGSSATDSFEYRITTGNGSSQAKVCLAIAGVAASSTNVASTSSASATSLAPTTNSASPTTSDTASSTTTSAPPLANTGAPSSALGAVGVGLIVVGGVATVAGARRRSRGRHA